QTLVIVAITQNVIARGAQPPGGGGTRPAPTRLSLGHLRRSVFHCIHDMLVPRASAEIALEPLTNLSLIRLRMLLQQSTRRHDHPGRAIAALQTMVLPETLLHRMQPRFGSESFNRRHLRAVSLNREQPPGLHRSPIEQNRACPADRSLTSDVGPCEPNKIADEMNKQQTRFNVCVVTGAIDLERDLHAIPPEWVKNSRPEFSVVCHTEKRKATS